MRYLYFKKILFLSLFFLSSCKNKQAGNTAIGFLGGAENTRHLVDAPLFNAKNAFQNLNTLVGYGFRIPGTPAHQISGDWIAANMMGYGFEVAEQSFDLILPDYTKVKGRNILASYNPKSQRRILIATHYDTRMIADKDPQNSQAAVPGANDGASGVAIMLEIARLLAQSDIKPNVGIDLFFFDGNDCGIPLDSNLVATNQYGGYCQGSEYWAVYPHKSNYSAFYGILLDMVGAKNATFMMDDASIQVAPSIVQKIWEIGDDLGFGNYFIDEKGAYVVNDHFPIIEYGRVPMILIMDQKKNKNLFFPQHHSSADDLYIIDEPTLKAVGQTLVQAIYQENGDWLQ